MKKEPTEEQLKFVAGCKALERKVRSNRRATRFSIFVLVCVWVVVVLDVVKAFTLPGELTLKHIVAQNNLMFHTLLAYAYTVWCCYCIPKMTEETRSEIKAFLAAYSEGISG